MMIIIKRFKYYRLIIMIGEINGKDSACSNGIARKRFRGA